MKWLEYKHTNRKENQNREELIKKHGLYMITYNNDNTQLVENLNLNDKSDIDMADSLLFMIYLSMSVCYMKLHHFELARTSILDSMKHNSKSSMPLFRMS